MRASVFVSIFLFCETSGQSYSQWLQRLNANNSLWSSGDQLEPLPPFPSQFNSTKFSPKSGPFYNQSSTGSTNKSVPSPKPSPPANKTASNSRLSNQGSFSVFGHLKNIVGKYPSLTILLVLLLTITIMIFCLLSISLQCSRLVKNWKNTSNRLNQLHNSSIIRNPQPHPTETRDLANYPYGSVPTCLSDPEYSDHPDPGVEANPATLATISTSNPRSFSTFSGPHSDNTIDNDTYENIAQVTQVTIPLLSQIPIAPPLPVTNAVP